VVPKWAIAADRANAQDKARRCFVWCCWSFFLGPARSQVGPAATKTASPGDQAGVRGAWRAPTIRFVTGAACPVRTRSNAAPPDSPTEAASDVGKGRRVLARKHHGDELITIGASRSRRLPELRTARTGTVQLPGSVSSTPSTCHAPSESCEATRVCQRERHVPCIECFKIVVPKMDSRIRFADAARLNHDVWADGHGPPIIRLARFSSPEGSASGSSPLRRFGWSAACFGGST
jgi:hypothetical protein